MLLVIRNPANEIFLILSGLRKLHRPETFLSLREPDNFVCASQENPIQTILGLAFRHDQLTEMDLMKNRDTARSSGRYTASQAKCSHSLWGEFPAFQPLFLSLANDRINFSRVLDNPGFTTFSCVDVFILKRSL